MWESSFLCSRHRAIEVLGQRTHIPSSSPGWAKLPSKVMENNYSIATFRPKLGISDLLCQSDGYKVVFHCCFTFCFIDEEQPFELNKSTISGEWTAGQEHKEKSLTQHKYSLSLKVTLHLFLSHQSTNHNWLSYWCLHPSHSLNTKT